MTHSLTMNFYYVHSSLLYQDLHNIGGLGDGISPEPEAHLLFWCWNFHANFVSCI